MATTSWKNCLLSVIRQRTAVNRLLIYYSAALRGGTWIQTSLIFDSGLLIQDRFCWTKMWTDAYWPMWTITKWWPNESVRTMTERWPNEPVTLVQNWLRIHSGLVWQSTGGKWCLTHWASLLRWIWSISEYNLTTRDSPKWTLESGPCIRERRQDMEGNGHVITLAGTKGTLDTCVSGSGWLDRVGSKRYPKIDQAKCEVV